MFEVERDFICPYQFKVAPIEHFNERHAPVIRYLWDSRNDYLFKYFDARRLHHALVYAFKVVDVTNLTRLCDASAVDEPLPAIVCDCFACTFSESAEHQEAADRCACAALACVTVHDHDVVCLCAHELKHLLAHLKQHIHCRRVMILPVVLPHHALELFVVVLAVTQVEYQVGVFVLVLQERCDLKPW